MSRHQNQKSRDAYTIGIICAMSFELSAVRYMLDSEHDSLPIEDRDSTIYTLGDVHGLNVVLACLPGQQGKGAAAIVAANMSRTFPCIKYRLVVGIGGGVPSRRHDIRLGDVVVSMPDGQHGGVVQYDLGKSTENGFQLTGFLHPPPPLLRSAVEKMESDHLVRDNKINEFIEGMVRKWPRLAIYRRPVATDLLFREDFTHGSTNISCARHDKSKSIQRAPRGSEAPMIHYGLIASGDSVVKSATKRSKMVQAIGDVLCFEMEAAGPMSTFPCIVIRGISDYADSHKNDGYHKFAAATAAACAKELLSYLKTRAISATGSIATPPYAVVVPLQPSHVFQ